MGEGEIGETFGPLPWLVTPDEIPNVDNLAMSLDVNGVRKQTGSTATMISTFPSCSPTSPTAWNPATSFRQERRRASARRATPENS